MQKTMKMADAFFENGGYEFLSDIESTYDCASMCEVPLFWITKDVSEGPATKECVATAIDVVTNQPGISAVLSISALLLFLTMFGSLTLCSGLSKEEEIE